MSKIYMRIKSKEYLYPLKKQLISLKKFKNFLKVKE